MRVVRFALGGEVRFGVLEGDEVLPARGDPFGAGLRPDGRALPLGRVVLLPPVAPGKVVGVGLNYADHARELGVPPPAEPLLFLKPPSAVAAPGSPIWIPPGVGRVDHEAEMAVVVGLELRWASPAEAARGIFGYTCANDVTAREVQAREGQWTRAKGYDTFCPLGPWVETDLDPEDLAVVARVNGELRQAGTTREMVFGPAELLSFISRVMTLLPGDVVLTGTPPGVGPLVPGDVVEVEVEGVGVLANPVEGVHG